jgi:hypothetical protein
MMNDSLIWNVPNYPDSLQFCPQYIINGIFIPNNGIIIAKNRDLTYNEPLFSRFGIHIVCNYLFNRGESTHAVG